MPEIPTTIKNKELVEKRREQIIRAAIRLFSKNGFYKTTLRDLSEEAGISQGNIYDYIGTKEDIFFLMHDYLASFAENELSRNVENIADPLEKLKEMVRTEFDMIYKLSDAILLIYQESHTLSRPLIKSLLEREKRHVTVFEDVLNDCIEKGVLRNFDKRIAATLLKGLIDTYVLRRWDLSKYVSIKEMERFVMDLFFHGLLKQKTLGPEGVQEDKPLEGKSILIVNGSTGIGRSLSSFLISKGARLAIHMDAVSRETELPSSGRGNPENMRFYLTKDYGELTTHLFDKIVEDLGAINVLIHHLGITDTRTTLPSTNQSSASWRVESNFKCAEDLPILLERSMNKSGSGRILYITPCAWDRYTSTLNYEVLKAGTVALTKAMAKRLASSRITVNCVVPGFISGIRPPEIEREKAPEIMRLTPLKYLGEIQDVLEAVYYFISDASKHVTGQILEITGGTT